MRGSLGRVRERLNKVVTESVPLDGHGNGYGGHGNGHGNGDGDHTEPAAVPSGRPEHAIEAGDGSPADPDADDSQP
jgi:hypothetical protein